jgi:halogenation protein CepH
VCVVGGGPGGSTTATFIAMQGHRVLLAEKESFPIYKIGESLLPATVHGICPMLGVTEELERAKFVHKLGGTFAWGLNKEPWTFSFAESSAFAGPTSFAYQVERMKFDKILIDNARRHGVDVRERHSVVDIVFDGDRVAGVELATPNGERIHVQCRYVVDASGHGSRISHHCGAREYSPFFQNVALFAYFNKGKRLPPPRSGNIFCVAFEKGWFWYIPLSDRLTSVGAVISCEHAETLRRPHDVVLQELIGECGPVRQLLSEATRVTDGPYGEVRVRKDWSYRHPRFWRPGLVLVGDSACFIDPVFSSGVHLATYAGLLAARSINSCLAGLIDEPRAFQEFQARYEREFGLFHDFLIAFYDMNRELDSYFWAARSVLHREEPAREAFVRLVGGGAGANETLYGTTDRFQRARSVLEKLMDRPETVTAEAETGDNVAKVGGFWSELNAEAVEMQVRGALKLTPIDEAPLLSDGLVASVDGLHWVEPNASTLASAGLAQRTEVR